MRRVTQWIMGLSLREKILVGVAGALTGVIFLLYGVIFPLQNLEINAKNELAEALNTRSEIAAAAAILKSAPQSAPPLQLPLSEVVSNSAAENGFAAQSMGTPNTKMVTITIESAKSPALLTWIAQLERQGIVVQNSDIEARDDGIVAAKLSFTTISGQ